MTTGFREQALGLNALSMTPEFGGALLGCFPEQHQASWAGKSQPLRSRANREHQGHWDPTPLGREGRGQKGSLYFLQKKEQKNLYIPYVKFTLHIQKAVTEARW